ncbi:MAG: AmmeMemoRadiSam system protein A [bacterium]
MPLTDDEKHTLRALARASIEDGLRTGRPKLPALDGLGDTLRAPGASFVTLTRDGDLRGCIGRLEAARPLALDVADNAFSAAFRDPRFPPLGADEWRACALKLSVLAPATPISFTDERDLIAQLVPGEDGLILDARGRRGTFLPAVWEQLGHPRDFVAHLKRKIGWPADHWPADVAAWRYRVEEF